MPGTDSIRRDDSSDGNELVILPSGRLSDEEAHIEENETGIQQQKKSEEHDLPNKMSPDASAHLWADLKAETGYTSYLPYLEAYETNRPWVKDLKGHLLAISNYYFRPEYPTCAILDVSDGDDCHARLRQSCCTSSSSLILAALRQPPAAVAARIVFWDASKISPQMLNALGLGLNIQPRYFQVVLARYGNRETLENVSGKFRKERKFAADIIAIGQYVVTIARQYLPENLVAPPVILITGHHMDLWENLQEVDEKFPFKRPPVQTLPNDISGVPKWMQDYAHVLEAGLQKGKESIRSDTGLFVQSLTTLLYLHMFETRATCDFARDEYLNCIAVGSSLLEFCTGLWRERAKTSQENLYEVHLLLRRMIEQSEDGFDQLQNFMHSQQNEFIGQVDSPGTIDEDLKRTLLESRRLETEIRDYLQLQAGQLAVQESRKSIELSNRQIEEGRRLKTFTILAFIYIPLNLATSIFGMNLEQLNGSGQPLRVFIITAVVALAVTGGSWFLIEQANSYLKWRKRSLDEPYNGETQFTLAVRLAILATLLSTGCTSWMFKSGAWWRILLNHRSRIVSRCCPPMGKLDQGLLNAGEWASKYSQKDVRMKWKDVPFYTEGIEWTSAGIKVKPRSF